MRFFIRRLVIKLYAVLIKIESRACHLLSEKQIPGGVVVGKIVT